MHSSYFTLQAMWITMRPYLLFVSGITGIAGMALGSTTSTLPLIAVFVASFFAYGFGQALTDCFQTDTDAISAPYRPLASGKVSRKAILSLSLAGLSACVTVFAVRNPWNLAIGITCAAGLATYTTFKRRWWGGPWYNAWIVTGLCIMGFLGANGEAPFVLPGAFLPMLLTVFFGYANFVLSGYFKDIDADAATGYNTFPVVFGRRPAAVASDLLALLFVLSSLWTATTAIDVTHLRSAQLPALMFALPGLFYLLTAQIQLHRNLTDKEAFAPILRVVHAYILLLSAPVVLLRPEWTISLVVHYVFFVIVLARRPEVSQI
jgi:geranylgeranylglycerol-phosphate geranylgeranyltransferase